MKSILITGGAGSLGKAFVKLLSSYPPDQSYKIIVVDNNEWALAELKAQYPEVECHLNDFSHYPFTGYEDYIIHCAAYKHVDLGESNPEAIIANNVLKTLKFYNKVRHSLTRLLYISTDKAVEPLSVYGTSKFLAERLTYSIGGSVARLGNILSSSGSVIPIWEKAIAEQRPIPITDERMTRYMIEDFDAVNQIWHEFKKGERLIIPKMEKPVRIMDMLAEVLKRHGYDSVEKYAPGVEIIGMRPGEKLEEKLHWDSELISNEQHD